MKQLEVEFDPRIRAYRFTQGDKSFEMSNELVESLLMGEGSVPIGMIVSGPDGREIYIQVTARGEWTDIQRQDLQASVPEGLRAIMVAME